MNTSMIAELLVVALLIAGAAFALLGAFGLVKLNDVYRRMHAPTKASTLGVGFILLAVCIEQTLRVGIPDWRLLLVTVFIFATAPISAHLLAKAALHRRPQDRPPVPEE